MQLPREVLVGKGTLELTVSICHQLGFKKSAFVVTGGRTYDIAGHKIIDLLQDSGLRVNHELVSSPTMEVVNMVGSQIKEKNPQVVVGVGGGTNIDVGKLSAADQDVPFISIPTNVSHDGIASPLASIKGSIKPYSVMAKAPMAIIADTELLTKVSHRSTASGCGDVIAKFTSVRDWLLAHERRNEYYGEYAASLALMSAKLVAKNAESIKPGNEEGIRVLLEALISCGVAMSIAGSSRPCSGSEHLFSHALDTVASKPALHGEQVAVGTIMMACLHGLNWRQVKSDLETVGAPTTAEKLEINPEYVVESLVRSKDIRPERYTILNKEELTSESATTLATKTGVI